MNRYLLRFYKKGNIRFISHLDLARLFKRVIRKAGVEIGFSNGYNPHELINIVQPLSLGYESECEYFELDTRIPYDTEELLEALNDGLPEGLRFFDCAEIPCVSGNLSNKTEYALYEAVLGLRSDIGTLDPAGFMSQDRIMISKKDKKTKQLKDKDVKAFIRSLELYDKTIPAGGTIADASNYQMVLKMVLRCASNETLNPGKLIESLFRYYNIDKACEECLITRKDLLAYDGSGELVSLYEICKKN